MVLLCLDIAYHGIHLARAKRKCRTAISIQKSAIFRAADDMKDDVAERLRRGTDDV
jgi:hypothetical protein